MADWSGRKVGIVDDSAWIRNLHRELCKELGLQVIFEAGDGIEALQFIAAGHTPDLLLLDILMPRMHGIEFLTELKAKSLEIPVLVVSAMASNESLEQAVRKIQDKAPFIVSKPLNKEYLKGVLEKLF